MSLPVFLHPDLSGAQVGQMVAIKGPEGRHAVTVKRITPGERVVLSDPEGYQAKVTVTDTQGKDLLVGSVDSLEQVPEPSPRVVLVQAIPKSERAELAIDLATQAGVDEIIAWQADRCVAKWDAKKAPKALAKWQAAATAAAKQSRRPRVPKISGPYTSAQVAQLLDQADCAYILHEEATASIKDVSLEGDVYVVVGPEGGIGTKELELLGATPVKLGPEVLRTASAAMVALSAIGVRTNRW